MKELTINSLSESCWIFGAFIALSSSGALPLLAEGTPLEALENRTKIPKEILLPILKLLISVGLITQDGALYKASGDLEKSLHQGGADRIASRIYSTFGQVRELVDSVKSQSLKMGWSHTDENILEAQGKFSEVVATDFIPTLPAVKTLVEKPGARFLDVGAGVGRITIKMCELYPQLQAVALEPAEHPFNLAKRNIANSQVSNHIELRKLGIQDLNDQTAFDVIWLAHGFIMDEFLIPGLQKIKQALKPGGMLFLATAPCKEGTSGYVKRFSSSLHGGNRSKTEITELLKNAGFSNITEETETLNYGIITATVN